MRRAFVVLLILSISSCAQNQHTKKIKGKVETIKVSVYEATEKLGEPAIKELDQIIILFFDDNNNVIEQIVYNQFGDKDVSIKYTYDKKNELISFVINNAHDGSLHTTENILKEKSRHISIRKNIKDGITTVDTIHYEMDKYGHPIKSIVINSDGTIYKELFNYNKKGDLLNFIWYNEDNNIQQQETNIYDKNRLMVKTYVRYRNGLETNDSILYSYKYKLDEKSNWVERIDYKNDEISKITKREIKYRK